jgi:hypothetical protein
MAIADFPSFQEAANAGDAEALQQIANFVHASTPIDQLIRQQYPQLAWALNNPEIGPMLQKAAAERWDVARLQGELLKTNWYKNTNASQREWQRLQAEDPGTALSKFFTGLNDIKTTASRLGVSMSENGFRDLAIGMASEGWDAARTTQEIMRMADTYDPSGRGEFGAAMAAAKAKAAEYMVPIGDDGAFAWAKNMLLGQTSQDGFDSYLREQAKARFAGDETIVTALDNGATTAQIFEPLRQQTAQLLERNPQTINLMDAEWLQMLDNVGDDGVRRPMTLAEAGKYVRSTSEWKGTQQAGQASAALGETLLKTFGEVG